MNHPVPKNEKERVQALRNYGILDSLEEDEFNNITEAASLICDTSISLISLIDENRQWIKAKKGIDITETHRSDSVCQYTILGDKIFEVTDLSKDVRFLGNRDLTDGSQLSFYAGFPLIDPNGYALGALCVIDKQPKKLNRKQKRLLELLAKNVVTLILERKHTQEAKYFAKLFVISKDLISSVMLDGTIKMVNPAFRNLLGWKEEDLLERNILEFVYQEDLKKTEEELGSRSLGKSTIHFTNRLLTKDGNHRTIQWSVNPNSIENQVFVVGRDITVETIKNQELEISENKLRSFFENSQGLMCTHDLSGNFLSVNQAGAAILGYEKSEILGMSLFDLVPSYHHEFLQNYLKKIKENRKDSGLMKTLHKNGDPLFWLYNNVLEQDADGNDYVIGNAIDMTERLKLERDLKKTKEMLEQTNLVSKVGGWEVDLVNNRTIWSDVTKRIHEVPADYEPNTQKALAFYEDESREVIQEAFQDAITKGIPYDLELQLLTAKGRLIWVRSYGQPEIVDGVCKRVYGAFQDITESHEKNQELKKAKLLAEQASKAKSEFLANMSHEIRTPLNGVIGFTDLILKTALNETQKEYLAIVNDSAISLLAIINDILDFSKIEAGKLELNIEKVDLFDLGEQVTNVITYQAQKKGLELLLDISPYLPRFIWADDARLKQILINLLGNAIKFTEAGEIELKIEEIERSSQENKLTLRFFVTDTGIGIQPDKQQKIFEAFAQEDSTISKKYGGTGLGLTISNKLLGLMGSTLALKSDVGFGSTFYFDLELSYEDGDPAHNGDLVDIQSVLVVDDNEHNRMILKRMLSSKQIDVESVNNGFDALQKLYDGKSYDLLIIDYHMPIIDGLEVIRKIRQNTISENFQVPIILLHSSSEDGTIIRETKDLAVSHLTKPINSRDMYEALKKIHNIGNVEVFGIDSSTSDIVTSSFEVLIAEDNTVNMLLTSTIITRVAPKIRISKAENGLLAVEACRAQMPDLIFMDIQMPELNGLEAARRIRLLPYGNDVIIIALTAGNVKGEREKCLAAGFNDFIAKPIVEKDIESKIKKWLAPKNEEDIDEQMHFNSKKIEEYADGDEQFARELIKVTISELEKASQKLQEGKELDLLSLNQLGHKLSGTASAAGLIVLTELANKLEKSNSLEEVNANMLVSQIQHEIQVINAFFKRKFS
ncbi:response regulator [Olivibacter domesticus]|uniref:Sensory/regulatory protein RpfC n=1 Tax=Olivibacter domesticus TaxID=407022 RepID=A0A1H7KXV6_OLID1|nr:response regulator [Olivibacter domesticus]SEK91380.1 PAS domain S-box-containing protein [Olivibacter domesticus]